MVTATIKPSLVILIATIVSTNDTTDVTPSSICIKNYDIGGYIFMYMCMKKRIHIYNKIRVEFAVFLALSPDTLPF